MAPVDGCEIRETSHHDRTPWERTIRLVDISAGESPMISSVRNGVRPSTVLTRLISLRRGLTI